MSLPIIKTKAPWAYEKVLPKESHTQSVFKGSVEYIENNLFQEKYGQSKEISMNYLIEFELMLHKINLFFSARKINSSFDNYFEYLGHHDDISFDGFTFKCEVFYCVIGYNPHPLNELVLKFVVTRPCVEGLGLYKVFLWQLILICRREGFQRLLVDFCFPENFEILRNYFGFDEEVDRYDKRKKNNCYITLKKMHDLGYSDLGYSEPWRRRRCAIPWGLERIIDKWSKKFGILLKNYESFAYDSQLNNEFYVNEKFRNIERGQGKYAHIMEKVNLKTPFYGYPDIDIRNSRNEMFKKREQPFEKALSLMSLDDRPYFVEYSIYDPRLVYIESMAPSENINPKPDYPYTGYPIYDSPTNGKTNEFSENIKESQQIASLHVPIHRGGYWLRQLPNGKLAPDYIGKDKLYFGTEYDTSHARKHALQHVYPINLDEQIEMMRHLQLTENQQYYPEVKILDNESLRQHLDNLDELLCQDLRLITSPQIQTNRKRKLEDV